jgi:hypothetical protein
MENGVDTASTPFSTRCKGKLNTSRDSASFGAFVRPVIAWL